MECLKRQKLLQFLMGLNDSYEQTQGQSLMFVPIPSVNQAYSMMIERESQRIMAHTIGPPKNAEITALISNKRDTFNKQKRNPH